MKTSKFREVEEQVPTEVRGFEEFNQEEDNTYSSITISDSGMGDDEPEFSVEIEDTPAKEEKKEDKWTPDEQFRLLYVYFKDMAVELLYVYFKDMAVESLLTGPRPARTE